jgi:hypothetical protein
MPSSIATLPFNRPGPEGQFARRYEVFLKLLRSSIEITENAVFFRVTRGNMLNKSIRDPKIAKRIKVR